MHPDDFEEMGDEPAAQSPGSEANHHEHHQSVINRLARIEGHVRAIKRMVEEDTPCPDVLVQIGAVRAALSSVGRLILEDHLQSCMVEAAKEGDYRQALRDLKNSLDKFID